MAEHIPHDFLLGCLLVNIAKESARWIVCLYFPDKDPGLIGSGKLEFKISCDVKLFQIPTSITIMAYLLCLIHTYIMV